MQNVRGRWLESPSTWRKISLSTWGVPNDPTVYGILEIDTEKLLPFLEERSESAGIKCTVTHAVTRAVAMTLRRYPECNVLVRGRRIWLRDEVDVFLQVAMPSGSEAGGADLSGAVVRRADQKRVEDIAREVAERARAVRAKKDGKMAKTRGLLQRMPPVGVTLGMKALGFLQYDMNVPVPGTPRDPFGGAMVTSLGMLGIEQAFAPIVTFSRAPIVIAIGEAKERPVVVEGAVEARRICILSGSFDHRVFDGLQAGRLAGSVKQLLEAPELLDERAEDALAS